MSKEGTSSLCKLGTVQESFPEHQTHTRSSTSPQRTDLDEMNTVYDLLAVGFGPASLAIAIAMYDENEEKRQNCGTCYKPKLKFLERQPSFGWHRGMILTGTKMQISFIKDLATLRNPRSQFTFMNYLKVHNRLVQFSNLGTFLPLRAEFEDYLRWSADHFRDVVEYSQNVIHIRPQKVDGSEKYSCLEVMSEDSRTGVVKFHRCQNAVIAVGGQPFIPDCFAFPHDSIIHSSEYGYKIANVLPEKGKSYSIAVIGAGQSAAEIFTDLQCLYPKARICMLIRDTALRPSDDSPFVNETFNPEEVDAFFAKPSDEQISHLSRNRATNYSVIRLELLERIYHRMYEQRLQDSDYTNWQHKILPSCEVVDVRKDSQSKCLNLVIKSRAKRADHQEQVLEVDAVILSTGYVRNMHERLMKHCQAINANCDGTWTVDRNYRVKLNRDLVTEDVQIYLQGCNENTHGLSDTLLSNLAVRGGEVARSIFGQRFNKEPEGNSTENGISSSAIHEM